MSNFTEQKEGLPSSQQPSSSEKEPKQSSLQTVSEATSEEPSTPTGVLVDTTYHSSRKLFISFQDIIDVRVKQNKDLVVQVSSPLRSPSPVDLMRAFISDAPSFISLGEYLNISLTFPAGTKQQKELRNFLTMQDEDSNK